MLFIVLFIVLFWFIGEVWTDSFSGDDFARGLGRFSREYFLRETTAVGSGREEAGFVEGAKKEPPLT